MPKQCELVAEHSTASAFYERIEKHKKKGASKKHGSDAEGSTASDFTKIKENCKTESMSKQHGSDAEGSTASALLRKVKKGG